MQAGRFQQLTPSVRWPVWGTGSRRSRLKLPVWCCCSPETETQGQKPSTPHLHLLIYYHSWCCSVSSGRHLHEARDVPESSQRAVRAQHVRRDDDAARELHTEHRRPSYHGVTAGGREGGGGLWSSVSLRYFTHTLADQTLIPLRTPQSHLLHFLSTITDRWHRKWRDFVFWQQLYFPGSVVQH